MTTDQTYDMFIIGGGVNGCGVARDASGRGLSVCLAEMNDLASGTSSASTKLIHGGLRYLRYLDFKLVREALTERKILLNIMPHICWPIRLVLPAPKSFFKNTLIWFALLLYNNMAGRGSLFPTRKILNKLEFIKILKKKFSNCYTFSDCWVEDSRLVILNALDAANRGATILRDSRVEKIIREKKRWRITIKNKEGVISDFFAFSVINAAGPWVETIGGNITSRKGSIKLVKGSHLVVEKLFNHGCAYFLMGDDDRVIFVIPYNEQFTLIGTTEHYQKNMKIPPYCSEEEVDYLLRFVNQYFEKQISRKNIHSSFSGVRPLFQSSNVKPTSASAITRDYVLDIETFDQLPILNIYGGKLTTYRKLSENVLEKLRPFFPKMMDSWTNHVPLPGGDFAVGDKEKLISKVSSKYPFVDKAWSKRLISSYGTITFEILKGSKGKNDLGIDFGHSLTEKEVRWLVKSEFAVTADDILWRRSKLGLKFDKKQKHKLQDWLFRNI